MTSSHSSILPDQPAWSHWTSYTLPDGGAIAASTSWIVRVDSTGLPLWDMRYLGYEFVMNRARTAIYGEDTDNIIKIDPADGSLIWSKSFDDGSGIYIVLAKDSGSGVFALGGHWLDGTLLDDDGNVVWTRSYSRPGGAFSNSFRVVESAGGGWCLLNRVDVKLQVTRLDADGVPRWSRRFTPPTDWNMFPWDIDEHPDGGVIFTSSLQQFGRQSFLGWLRGDGRLRTTPYYRRTDGLCFFIGREIELSALAIAPDGRWAMTGEDNYADLFTGGFCSFAADMAVYSPYHLDALLSFTDDSHKFVLPEAPVTFFHRVVNTALEPSITTTDVVIPAPTTHGVVRKARLPLVLDETGNGR